MPLLENLKSLTLGRRRRENVSLWGSRAPHLPHSLMGTQGTYTLIHQSDYQTTPHEEGGDLLKSITSSTNSLPSTPYNVECCSNTFPRTRDTNTSSFYVPSSSIESKTPSLEEKIYAHEAMRDSYSNVSKACGTSDSNSVNEDHIPTTPENNGFHYITFEPTTGLKYVPASEGLPMSETLAQTETSVKSALQNPSFDANCPSPKREEMSPSKKPLVLMKPPSGKHWSPTQSTPNNSGWYNRSNVKNNYMPSQTNLDKNSKFKSSSELIMSKQQTISSLQSTLKKLGASVPNPVRTSFKRKSKSADSVSVPPSPTGSCADLGNSNGNIEHPPTPETSNSPGADDSSNYFVCYSSTVMPQKVAVVSLPISSSSSSLSSYSSSEVSSGLDSPSNCPTNSTSFGTSSISTLPQCSQLESVQLVLNVSRQSSKISSDDSTNCQNDKSQSQIEPSVSNTKSKPKVSSLSRTSFKSDMITYQRKAADEIKPKIQRRFSTTQGNGGCNGRSFISLNSDQNISPVLRSKLSRVGVSKIESSEIRDSKDDSRVRKRSLLCDNFELPIGDVPSCMCNIKEDGRHSPVNCKAAPLKSNTKTLDENMNAGDLVNYNKADHLNVIPSKDIELIRHKILYRKPSSVHLRHLKRVNSMMVQSGANPRVLIGSKVRRAKSFKAGNEKDWDSAAEATFVEDNSTGDSNEMNETLMEEQAISSQTEEGSASGFEENKVAGESQNSETEEKEQSTHDDTNSEVANEKKLVKWVIKVDNNSIEEEEDFYYDSLDDYDEFDKYYFASQHFGDTGEIRYMDDEPEETFSESYSEMDEHVNMEPVPPDIGGIQKLRVKLIDSDWKSSGEKFVAKLVNHASFEKDESSGKSSEDKKLRKSSKSKKSSSRKSKKKRDSHELKSSNKNKAERKRTFALSVDNRNSVPCSPDESLPVEYITSQIIQNYENALNEQSKLMQNEDSRNANRNVSSPYIPFREKCDDIPEIEDPACEESDEDYDRVESFFSSPITADDENKWEITKPDDDEEYQKLSHHLRSNIQLDGSGRIRSKSRPGPSIIRKMDEQPTNEEVWTEVDARMGDVWDNIGSLDDGKENTTSRTG